MRGLVRPAGAVLSGVLYALAFPEPGLWPLVLAAWVPLLLALRGASTVAAAGLGWLAGTVAFAILLRWIAPLSTLGLFALSTYLGAFVAGFAAVVAHVHRRLPSLAAPAAVAAFVALEWMRSWLFGGFGWGAAGYALAPVPLLAQLAAVGGVPLLSACTLTANVAATEAVVAAREGARRRAAIGGFAALLVVGAMAVHGAFALPGAAEGEAGVLVTAVQADVSPRERWERGGVYESMQRYVRLTDAAVERDAPRLVVWPETAIPTPLGDTGVAARRRGLERRVAERWRTPVLLGVPERAGDALYNTAILLTPGGAAPEPYRKRRLVPFGEYVPDLPLLSGTSLVIPGPEFDPGAGGVTFREAPGAVGVLICFEDLFADEALARSRDASLLAVITNDGWFDPAGKRQHLDVAVLRAIETRRPVVRAASTGISAIIDPWGRRLAELPAGPGHVSARVRPTDGESPYALFPDGFPILCVLVAAFSVAWSALTASGRASRSSSAPNG